MEYRRAKLLETESIQVAARESAWGGVQAEIKAVGQMVQTSSYKMDEFWGFNVVQGDYTVLYI